MPSVFTTLTSLQGEQTIMITATCLENKSYGQVGVRCQLGTSPTEKGAECVSGAEGHSSWSAASKQKERGEAQEEGMSPHQGWWAKRRGQLIPTFTETAAQQKHRTPDKPIFSRWHGRVSSTITFSIFHYQQS